MPAYQPAGAGAPLAGFAIVLDIDRTAVLREYVTGYPGPEYGRS